MVNYSFSPEARVDLLAIWDYIANDNIDAADRVEKDIIEAITILASNPELGHFRRDLTSRRVRFWRIHSYLIIYDPGVQPLEVVRILSGYRDVANLLK
jgi:plasmid stabilization system protein ParE